jgi:primosomal protein N' (replication factor Y)
MKKESIVQVALAAPLMQLFDYLVPHDCNVPLNPGQRVTVPFGKKRRVGLVIRVASSSPLPRERLRRIDAVLDTRPVFDAHLMALLQWAANYYHHPPGEVFTAALPGLLRRGRELPTGETRWAATTAGCDVDVSRLARRAAVQARILGCATRNTSGLTREDLSTTGTRWRDSLAALVEKGWLERQDVAPAAHWAAPGPGEPGPTPTAEQQRAVSSILAAEGFVGFLLEGVTGSGKTEVYLRCIEKELAAGRQSLVLVPEIGLTPQLVDRFRRRLATPIEVMHSALTDRERLSAWTAARDGRAAVVIGTRSAIFTPLARPGLIVVDEEHDSSFKQQEGFRYSARDVAVWRARNLNVPIVLGSATPSFESLENVRAGRYRQLQLPQRPGSARQPVFRLVDLRKNPATDGLTQQLIAAIQRHLAAGDQVLIFLNRRGFAPSLVCGGCGGVMECSRCDSRLVLHRQRDLLICHHCGAQRSVPDRCPACAQDLHPVGQGTERLEHALQERFPEHSIVRIDRDTTRRRGEIERRLAQVRAGEARLLLGTQMLTKGHDFPRVTLVGIVDADQGLFGTDFRSSERLAQTVIQVAGRAGRAERPGEVYIQTLFPDHPLLSVLVSEGYDHFAAQAMAERREAGWPPCTYLALLRAEAAERKSVFAFLDSAVTWAQNLSTRGVRLLGPAPAPMERRSGRYRGQLLIRAETRRSLQRFLDTWRPGLDELPHARRARWSLDVDPVELF